MRNMEILMAGSSSWGGTVGEMSPTSSLVLVLEMPTVGLSGSLAIHLITQVFRLAEASIHYGTHTLHAHDF